MRPKQAVHRLAEFPQGDTYGVTVYHGSREPDLDYIEGGYPPYKGGIGGGVYVDFDEDVARFYGKYVYALRLLIHSNEIFYPETYNIPELEGNSILVGEFVEPFTFEMNGQKYAVTGSFDIPYDWDAFFEKLKKLLTSKSAWEAAFEFPYNRWLAETIWDNITGLDEEGRERFDGEISEDIDWEELEETDPEMFAHLYEQADHIDKVLLDFTGEHLHKKDYGIEIDLDDIGSEVESAGYKAVYIDSIRGGFPSSELLVFDSDDLELLGRVEDVERGRVEGKVKRHKSTRTVTDTIVETCGRNYILPECRNYKERAFRYWKEDEPRQIKSSAPGYLYHTTFAKHLPSIAGAGLKPGGVEQNFPAFDIYDYVYLTTGDAAREWAYFLQYNEEHARNGLEKGLFPVVLRVDISKLRDGLEIDEAGTADMGMGTAFRYPLSIPPSALEILDTDDKWIPVAQASVDSFIKLALYIAMKYHLPLSVSNDITELFVPADLPSTKPTVDMSMEPA